ncbi:M61 family metallopeptidase [Pseudoalteromonas xiamenensis]
MKLFSTLLLVISMSTQAVELNWQGLDNLSTTQRTTFQHWVNAALDTNQSVLGNLNLKELNITVKGLYFATEPVPWAFVNREPIESIELQVYRYASLERLKKDWTLYHEIVHLYHPRLETENFWLSEGLATYLQNIIMLKANILTNQEYQKRLNDGFQRGEKSMLKHKGALNKVSDGMWSTKAYQRVYWSGTAFFLEADLALRVKTNLTLVDVIQKYQTCCRRKFDSGAHFIEQLDSLSQSAVFSTLFVKYRNRTDFPRISPEQIRQASL